jgi:hypothetical protein
MKKAHPLGSRIKKWNLLEKETTVSSYSRRQSDVATYSPMDGDLMHCNNIRELMEELQLEHTF